MTIVERTMCTGCFACATICPKSCITMTRDEEGFLQPTVDDSICINCGLCKKTCPVVNKINTSNQPTAYAVQNKNEEIRMNSSSGGVFTLFAEHVINNGGVVFGAAFDDDFNVVHIAVDNTDDLHKLRGSKYVQSTIGDSYAQAKEYLEGDRLVYFSGTPCQIGGLLSYLGKEYNNLITQDIICHGVPSPLVWQKYLKYQSANLSSQPNSISFRKKNDGYSNFFMSIDFVNGQKYEIIAEKDPMMISFFKNQCLRESCYNCSFKTINRSSDVTLADFWGVQNIHPEMNDKKGTSLVLVNSSKGKKIFESVASRTVSKQSDVDKALSYNSPAVKSVVRPSNRDLFIKKINFGDFEIVVRELCKDSFSQTIKKYIKKPIKKIKLLISNS